MELKDKKISAISLGCDKNRVDLEKMLFRLSDYGFKIVENVEDADIVIVNTCAFIEPARKEAVDNIFDMLLLKEQGKLEKVIVSGCLPQRYLKELKEEIKEVDAFLTLEDNEKICEIVEKLYDKPISKQKKNKGRILTNHSSYAYLKIAEGCSNGCSFCTIPRIKGGYRSFPIEDIVDEAKDITSKGVKELILVAQDVSRYGEDLYKENRLILLLQKLVKIKGIEWIRLHYIYPEKITKELLDYIYKEPKICNYIDIPLQHIDDKILKSMRRRLDEKGTRELVSLIKTNYPEIHIRSTFIVGYPGETRADFKKLCNLLREAKFDFAGFFPYFREENTASFYMDKQVSERTKKARYKKVQKIQHEIVFEKAKEMLGKEFKVLVDSFNSSTGNFIGHTEFFSPTVDFGVEIIYNEKIEVGTFVNVKFISFDGENFKGELV